MGKIVYTELKTTIGKLLIASSPEGICKISILKSIDEENVFFSWLKKHYPEKEVEKVDTIPQLGELKEYFKKNLKVFTIPLDLRGTPFQIKVWEVLKKIPYGETRSYKDIAVELGKPGASRAVGGANRNNPIPVIIPCHRVIGSDGSLKGYGGKNCVPAKKILLNLEGKKLP